MRHAASIPVTMCEVPPRKRVLMLRTCFADMRGYGGLRWPQAGYVEAPAFDPSSELTADATGLCGLLWGHGAGTMPQPDARWLVCIVDLREVARAGPHHIAVPRAWVIYCGTHAGALRCLHAHHAMRANVEPLATTLSPPLGCQRRASVSRGCIPLCASGG